MNAPVKKPRGYVPTEAEVREAVLMLALHSHRELKPHAGYQRGDPQLMRWDPKSTLDEIAAYIGCSRNACRAALRPLDAYEARTLAEAQASGDAYRISQARTLGRSTIRGVQLNEAHSQGFGSSLPETYSPTPELLMERLAAAFALAPPKCGVCNDARQVTDANGSVWPCANCNRHGEVTYS